MIAPGACLGLLGGGQLGRMFAMAAQSMGYRVAVLEAEGEFGFALPCPALDGARCTTYATRPGTCRTYRCKLLRALEAEDISFAEAAERILDLYYRGQLQVLVDRTPFRGLERTADAVEHLLAGRNAGKVIVTLR